MLTHQFNQCNQVHLRSCCHRRPQGHEHCCSARLDLVDFEAREFDNELELEAREFDDGYELEAREFDDELDARDIDNEFEFEAREDNFEDLEARIVKSTNLKPPTPKAGKVPAPINVAKANSKHVSTGSTTPVTAKKTGVHTPKTPLSSKKVGPTPKTP
ncbi:hypothetical protein NLJ89_g10685 [Agrocybe chaxingu]|uniref:Uncharacterized protein n=1 Tax=Agrocybe chaxingu TaxID=84603 RepID=A0A9W8JRA5_9AGAR|nr:hypothetical protein NLJ89_g10685 [Agrocybe chaxingu]